MDLLGSDSGGVPVEGNMESQAPPPPEKDEDVGIVFVARKLETPKQRPKSGERRWTWEPSFRGQP